MLTGRCQQRGQAFPYLVTASHTLLFEVNQAFGMQFERLVHSRPQGSVYLLTIALTRFERSLVHSSQCIGPESGLLANQLVDGLNQNLSVAARHLGKLT